MANPWEEFGAAPAAPAAPPPAQRDVGRLRRGKAGDPYVYDEQGNAYDPRGDTSGAPFRGTLGDNPAGEYADGLTGTVTDDGTYSDPLGDQTIVKPREPVGAGSAAWSGLKSGALMGFDDEWQAGWGAAGNKLGTLLGLNASTASLPEIYDAILKQNRQRKDAAYQDNPLAYGAGFVPGTLMSAFALPGARAAQAETLMGRLGQAGAQGAQAGAISGAGNAEDGFWNRMAGAAEGGLIGGPMGVLSYPISRLVSNLAGRGYRALRPDAGPDSGLDVLAARAPQDVEALRAGTGRLVDRVDESGRGVIRDAASKMTPGRDAVTRHADQVYSGAQDRVADVARRELTPNPQTARQLERQIRGDKNLGGDNEAGILMGQEMEPLRSRTINVDDNMKAVLSTREGQAALRAAEGLMTDPAERAQARAMLAAARKAAKGPVDPEDAFRAEVKGWDELPDAVKDAYRQQRPDLLGAGDPFAGVTLSLDLADKFSRAMRGRAASTPGLERVAEQFAQTVRGSARQQVPEYDAALNAYQGSQRVADAAAGTGPFEESKFLSTPADTYAASVGMASRQPAAAPVDGQPTVSEIDALIRRARDEIVDRATSGAGQNAGATARQIAFGGGESGAGQAARSRALLGEERANRLAQGMEQEVNRVRNTEFIDPRRGSQTHGRGQDAIVDGFADALAATTSKWSAIHTATKWLRQGGIKGVDAERLARDAISEDPARINAAIDYLASRGMARARAERFVNIYGATLAGRVGGASVGDGETAPR